MGPQRVLVSITNDVADTQRVVAQDVINLSSSKVNKVVSRTYPKVISLKEICT